MSEVELKPGDVVVLKSGGPVMTIASAGASSAQCVWFEDKKKCSAPFPLEVLKIYEEEKLDISINYQDVE